MTRVEQMPSFQAHAQLRPRFRREPVIPDQLFSGSVNGSLDLHGPVRFAADPDNFSSSLSALAELGNRPTSSVDFGSYRLVVVAICGSAFARPIKCDRTFSFKH